jgi:hypothetical protein
MYQRSVYTRTIWIVRITPQPDAVGDIFGSRARGRRTAEVGDTAQNGRAGEGERCRARKATRGIEGRRRAEKRRRGGLEVEEERARRRRSQWRRRRLGGAGGEGADEAGRASLRPRAEGAGGPTCRRCCSETRDHAGGKKHGRGWIKVEIRPDGLRWIKDQIPLKLINSKEIYCSLLI